LEPAKLEKVSIVRDDDGDDMEVDPMPQKTAQFKSPRPSDAPSTPTNLRESNNNSVQEESRSEAQGISKPTSSPGPKTPLVTSRIYLRGSSAFYFLIATFSRSLWVFSAFERLDSTAPMEIEIYPAKNPTEANPFILGML